MLTYTGMGGRSLNAQNKADIIYDSSSSGKTIVLPTQWLRAQNEL